MCMMNKHIKIQLVYVLSFVYIITNCLIGKNL